jgi:hypothetical protein
MRYIAVLVAVLFLATQAFAESTRSRTRDGVHAEVDRLSDGRYAMRVVVLNTEPRERRTVVLPSSVRFSSLRLRDFLADGWPDPLFTFRDGCCLRSWVVSGGDDPLTFYAHRWGPAGFSLRSFGHGPATAFATRAVSFARSFGRGPVDVAPMSVLILFDDGRLWTRSDREPFARRAFERDARRLRTLFRRGRYRRRAAASLTAEHCLLGRCRAGYSLVRGVGLGPLPQHSGGAIPPPRRRPPASIHSHTRRYDRLDDL